MLLPRWRIASPMRTKSTGPGLVRSRLAELEASEGDHMFGRSDQTNDWSMAVDTWLWWVVMQ